MGKVPAELSVISKTYDLLLWTARHVERFPRSHRMTLGTRLEAKVYAVLEKLLRAKFQRNRGEILRDVNLDLELLRFQYRVARDLKCLSLDSYGFAARTVNEIGQMVGGWLKSNGGSSPEPRVAEPLNQ